MIWIKHETLVATVSDYYLDIIADGLRQAGQEVAAVYEWEDMGLRKGDRVVTIAATRAQKLWNTNTPYYYWAQGIWPEESYMRYGSRLRFWLQGCLEKRSLKKAEFVFFVSKAMKRHFEKKYKLDFEGRHYIMPCANEALHADSFHADGKYEENVFCYAGAMSAWQCFEETVALYAKLEAQIPNAKLLLLVKERETALSMLEKYGVRNFEIDYVPTEQLPQRLRGVKFGFVLRQPSPVNQVATPTKVVTYLANGILPIYSSCLDSVGEILNGSQFPIAYHNDGNLTDILRRATGTVDAGEVYKEFESIYDRHYCRQKHTQQIAAVFKARLE